MWKSGTLAEALTPRITAVGDIIVPPSPSAIDPQDHFSQAIPTGRLIGGFLVDPSKRMNMTALDSCIPVGLH